MTKRMLSLLLALVMTLSLCVPALAADEFAAEAVTEVEEQAPEAPEAVAEPEVEEIVAAEPEVIVADAPEKAAFSDSQVQATEADYLALHEKIDAYADEYALAKNGKMIGNGYTFADWWAGKADTSVNDFIKDYEAAVKKYNEKGGYAVPDQSVITGLADALDEEAAKISGPKYDGESFHNNFTDANGKLVAGFDAIYYWAEVIAQNESTYKTRLQDGWFKTVEKLYYDMKYVFDNGYPIKDMLAVLATALKGNDAVWWAIQGFDHTGAGPAYDPNLAPGKAVKASVADGERMVAAKKALEDAIDKASQVTVIQDIVDEAKSYLNSVAVGFEPYNVNQLKDYVTHADVLVIATALEDYAADIIADTRSTKISSWRFDWGLDNLYVFVELTTKYDDMAEVFGNYQLSVTMNGSNHKFAFFDYTQIGGDEAGIGVRARAHATVTKNDLLNAGKQKFIPGETLTVELLDKDGNRYGEPVTITVSKDTSPKVIAQGYTKSAVNATAPDEGYFYLTFNAKLDYFNDHYSGSRIEITRPDTTTWKKNEIGSLIDPANNLVWTDDPVQVGTYTIKYYVTESDGQSSEEIGPQTVSITVKDVTGTTAYENLTKTIAKVAGYEKLVVDEKKSDLSTADAQAVVARFLKAANDIVAKASTMADTNENVAAITKANTELAKAYGVLTTAADQSALIAALDAYAKLVETDYTPESWKNLKDAVTAGEKVRKENVSDSMKDAKAIEVAAKDINNAIKALGIVKPTTELETLKALVASVPAKLASDNYTAASKAAVNNAVAAANSVLAKSAPLKSEVKKATDDLQAALNALKIEPAEPEGMQPPKGGTGWVYDSALDAYYYFEDGQMMKDFWMQSGKGSAHGLWYYLGADGKMVTGFQYVSNAAGTGWFMFQKTDVNGMRGAVLSGWQNTGTDKGWGFFEERHNGHFGECTYTDLWGDYSPGYVPMNPTKQ